MTISSKILSFPSPLSSPQILVKPGGSRLPLSFSPPSEKKPYWIQQGWLHFAIFRTPLFFHEFLTNLFFIVSKKNGLDRSWVMRWDTVYRVQYACQQESSSMYCLVSKNPHAIQESNEYAMPDTSKNPKEIREILFRCKSWGRPARGKSQPLRGFHRNPGNPVGRIGDFVYRLAWKNHQYRRKYHRYHYSEKFLHSLVPVQYTE